jgi:hypothetical protein
MRAKTKARGRINRTARNAVSVAAYVLLTALASLFGSPFWVCEQLRWRVADRIDNERSAQ